MSARTEDIDKPLVTGSLGVRQTRVNGLQFSGVPDVKSPDGELTITYVAGRLLGNTWHGPNFWYGDVPYYRQQQELLSCLAGLPDSKILVKLHYKDQVSNPLPRFINSDLDSNITVYNETPYMDIVDQTDIAVFGEPFTAFLESLLAGKPVLYLDTGWYNWTEEGETLLRQAMPVVDGTEDNWNADLVDTVDRIRSGDVTFDYEPFLRAFADPEFDTEPFAKLLERIDSRADYR